MAVLMTYFLTCSILIMQMAFCEEQRTRLVYEITEGMPSNTHIADIGVDAYLEMKYGPEAYRAFEYSFLRPTDPAKDYFTIDSNSGSLMSREVIDREAICEPSVKTCAMKFDVAIKPVPVTYLEVISVNVTITDVNDNAPEFPKSEIALKISENVLPGASFVIPTARDPDSGMFAVQRYDFSATGNKFSLTVTNNTDGTIDLRLILEQKLDREERTNYKMTVTAQDGGVPPKSGSILINVTVLDSNDNSPRFDLASYEVYVAEDTTPGTTLLRVHASDPDEGANGRVTYSLARDPSENSQNLFGINNLTGDVYLLGEIDFEESEIYNLLVTAMDSGPDAVPTHARVIVRVRDINDHVPVISVNALTDSGQAEIPENAQVGHFVAHISIIDEDGGNNGEISCTLSNDNFRLERIFLNEYTLKTTRTFDREEKSLYRIILNCQDQGDYPRRSTAEIEVIVTDENDNTPVFSQDLYVASMRENNTINSPILIVNATDRDTGPNGRITYSLSPEASEFVRIDGSSGVIRAVVAFDYEQMHDYIFTVYASDNGAPTRSASSTVSLNFIDINDEMPEFKPNAYSFAIYENEKAGSSIGQVSATDPDTDPYNIVVYSLRNPHISSGEVFAIDPVSGVITTKTILDREYMDTYHLEALASNPNVQFTSTANVTVQIADKNDNAPSFLFPSPQNNTVQVPFTAPIDAIVTRVIATDPDSHWNSMIHYSIVKGNDGNFFQIDERTGAIMVNSEMLGLQQLDFHLLIEAKDGGDPPQSAVSDLNLHINKSLIWRDVTESGYTQDSQLIKGFHNRTIVIGLAGATFFLIIILITAIICIKKRHRRAKHEEYRYMCRVDSGSGKLSPSTKSCEDMDGDTLHHPAGNITRKHNGHHGGGLIGPAHHEEEKKKEVRFSVADDEGGIDGPETPKKLPSSLSWRADIPQETQVPITAKTKENVNQRREMSEGNNVRRSRKRPLELNRKPLATVTPIATVANQPVNKNPSLSATRTLTKNDLEVHQLLHAAAREGHARNDSDNTSACSVDVSNTDSGRGPSEDGEHQNHNGGSKSPDTIPPPPYEWMSGDGSRCSSTLPRQQRGRNGDLHRKTFSNTLAPPGRRGQNNRRSNSLATNNPYSKVPMPFRLVDPREDNPQPHSIMKNGPYRGSNMSIDKNRSPSKSIGVLGSSNGSPTHGSLQSNSLCNISQARPATSGSMTLPNGNIPSHRTSVMPRPGQPGYVNTFGQSFPLRTLGRSEDMLASRSDNASDCGSTTTSGSYDVHHAPDNTQKKPGIVRMDTVV